MTKPPCSGPQAAQNKHDDMIHTSNSVASDWVEHPPATRLATHTAPSVSGWIKQRVSSIKPAVIQQLYNLIPGMAFTFSNDKLEEDSRTLDQTQPSKTVIDQQPRHSVASFPAPLPTKLMVPNNVQQPSAPGLAAQTQAAGT